MSGTDADGLADRAPMDLMPVRGSNEPTKLNQVPLGQAEPGKSVTLTTEHRCHALQLAAGKHTIVFDFKYDSPGIVKGARVR